MGGQRDQLKMNDRPQHGNLSIDEFLRLLEVDKQCLGAPGRKLPPIVESPSLQLSDIQALPSIDSFDFEDNFNDRAEEIPRPITYHENINKTDSSSVNSPGFCPVSLEIPFILRDKQGFVLNLRVQCRPD